MSGSSISPPAEPHRGGAVVVMGVSGCGKSTLGRALADALGWRFVEGDMLHPPANIAKMAAGVALDDDDREPFLEAVGTALAAGRAEGVVAACSALRRAYRDRLRAAAGDIVFVLPLLDGTGLLPRLAARAGHFMPASLLDSQLATLELPDSDERAILLDGASPLDAQLTRALAALHTRERR